MIIRSGQTLYSDDLHGANRGCEHRAGAHRRPIELYGAGTAESGPAAILAANEAQMIPQDPKQRRRWIQLLLDDSLATIHLQAKHGDLCLATPRLSSNLRSSSRLLERGRSAEAPRRRSPLH